MIGRSSKMPVKKATAALIKNLERMNGEHLLMLTSEQIVDIATKIVSFFHEIRLKVNQHDYLSTSANGRIVWSPEYQKEVDVLKERFLDITRPIGMVGPGDLPAVLWIGDEGITAAKKFGHPTQFTLPIALIDCVIFAELKEAFFPDVFKNIKDTAVPCIYWSILSTLYASNIKGDVNLFMIENPIHSISFFWNFELKRIQENRQRVVINKLRPSALHQLKILKEKPDKSSADEAQMTDLLTTASNWTKSSMQQGLRVTSGAIDGVSISYAKLLEFVGKWRRLPTYKVDSPADIDQLGAAATSPIVGKK